MKDFFVANSNITKFVVVTTLSICIIFSLASAAILVVKLVDSRFKHLAASFQHQIDELKLEVGSINLSSNHGDNCISHNDQYKKSKRQVPIKNNYSNITLPKQAFCAIGSSPCTFYYADNPDSNQTRLQPSAKSINKTLPTCESSSLLCNFYHPDHPNVTVASRKTNTNKTNLINNINMISKNETTTSQNQTTIALVKSTSNKGMPKNCSDLQLFGHSLNGFYLVAPNEGSKIETVYCDFQMTVSSDLKGFETRIGIVDVKSSLVQFFVDRNPGNYGDKDKGPKNQKIKFNNLVLNTSGGFDWKNQYFQAPVAGTYVFSVTGSKCGGGPNGTMSRASILMLHNGEHIAEALSSEGNSTLYGGFSYQTTRKLNATDKIELVLQWGQLYLIYFTGWLLEQNLILM